jgi:hypothetical protein
MSVIGKLMDAAIADVEVLRSLDRSGDQFGQFRDVEFLFRCPDLQKANLVAAFINDYQFGQAVSGNEDGESTVLVTIRMPVEQHIILSVSGFMTCLAELYGLEFDGWGCVAVPRSA